MALTPGTRFGPYEVTAQIGVDGMGEAVGQLAHAGDTECGPRTHWLLLSSPC